MSSRAANRAAAERVTSDLLPECVCGDINDFGADRCEGCGRKLHGPKLAALPSAPPDDLQRWWLERHTPDELRDLSGWAA